PGGRGREGTRCSRVPGADWNRTSARCVTPPAPAVPADAATGAALSHAISSPRSFAGTVALVAITSGWSVSSDTGAKSFTTSYGNGRIAPVTTCVPHDPHASAYPAAA